MGSVQIPTDFTAVLQLAHAGGIPTTKAREIYDQVESAVLGGWPKSAARAGVPDPMIKLWQREIDVQTKALRASIGR